MTPLFWWTKSTGWAWDTFHSSQNTNNSLASLTKSKETRNSVFYFWLQKGVRFTTYRWHPDHTPSGRQCSQMEELGHTRNLGFIPTPVLMYSTLASELLSVSSISQKYTYICHSFFFFSPSSPLKGHAHLYPLSCTQVPWPKPQHSPHWCYTTLGVVKCKLGPQHVYVERGWCCALYHCQRKFLSSSRIFSQMLEVQHSL